MLRADTESKVESTQEKIEKFYHLIAKSSYDKHDPSASSFEILRRNYFEYLRICLETPERKEKFLKEKKKYLLSNIKIHRAKHFGSDLEMVDLVEKDIAENGSELAKFNEDKRADLMTAIRNIQNRCQSSIPMAEKTFPDAIRTGLSTSEISSTTYSPFHQTWSVSYNLNAEGIEHFNKKEWETAIAVFERAILAEIEMSAETKTSQNETNLVIYQRNVAASFNQWALEFYNNKQYQTAIDYFNKSLSSLDRIQSQSRADKQTRMDIYRNISYSYNAIGVRLFEEKLYQESAQYFQKSIDERKQINEECRNELDDTNFSISYRNLAKVFYDIADTTFLARQDEAAVENFKKTLESLSKISISEDEDIAKIAYCNRKLAMLYNHNGSVHFLAGRYHQAKENFSLAITTFKKIPIAERIRGDKFQEQIYVTNLRNLLQILRLQDSLTRNRYALFSHDRGTRDTSDTTQESDDNPNPKKRRRIGS